MRRHFVTRLGAPLLTLTLAFGLAACDGDQEAQQDPRGALRDAVAELEGYEGVELVFGAHLDDAARQSAMAEGDMDDDELALLTESTLTIRGVSGTGEEGDDGESEIELIVGDESVFLMRALSENELYALVDLPAVERVAESLDAGQDFQQSLSEFEQMAGMFGLGEVAAAARDAEWIRVAGLDQMMEMAEQQNPDAQPDQADMEQLAEDLSQRLVVFFDDEQVAVEHLDSDDAGERIRVTAAGAQLRSLVADLFQAVDDAADLSDPTGTGMDPAQLRDELEQSIPDDTRVSFDAWIDGGELSQIAVDVFEVAREGGADDVPDGEFLVAIGLAEFTGPVDAPETDVTFDVFEMFGDMMGGMGDLGGDPFADDGLEEAPGDGLEDAPEAECVPPEIAAEIFDTDVDDLDETEVESMLGAPLC